MKVVVVLAVLITALSGYSQDQWFQVDSMNGPGKSVASAFVLYNEGYVVGGLTDQDFTRKMYSFNPDQNDWDNELSWGGETGNGQNRGSSTSFVIDNKVYIGLGQGNSALYYKDWWTYDPLTETWTQLSDFIGTARHGAVGFTIDQIGYLGTGQDVNGLCKDFFKYNPANNQWAQLTDFNGSARKFAIGVSMGGEAYIGFGDDGSYKKDLWQYNVFADEWTQKAAFPGIGRSGATAWSIFPSLYVACGETATGTSLNDVWEYNFWSNSWIQRASIPGLVRKHPVSFVIHNIAYVGAGYSNGLFLDDFYGYLQAPLGVDENTAIELSLYPNPCANELHVLIKNEIEIKSYAVIDETGKTVLNGNFIPQITVNELKNGSYRLVLSDKQGNSFSKTFIKHD